MSCHHMPNGIWSLTSAMSLYPTIHSSLSVDGLAQSMAQEKERQDSSSASELCSRISHRCCSLHSQLTPEMVGFISLSTKIVPSDSFLGQGIYCTMYTIPRSTDVGYDLKVPLETNNDDRKLLLLLV